MSGKPLIGTWKLSSWDTRDDEGDVAYPFGRDAPGYITYTEDGTVSVVITTAGRFPFASGDLLGGTTEEKAAAAETCVAYCGTYEIKGDRVFHHVEVSSFPNWAGSAQERIFERNGDRLLLRSLPYLLGGRQQTAYLLWELV